MTSHLQWQELVVARAVEGQRFETSTVASGAGLAALTQAAAGKRALSCRLRSGCEQLGEVLLFIKVAKRARELWGSAQALIGHIE